MPRPISAVIHTAALANNLAIVRRLAPHSKAWAVVKANAYGHGLIHVFSGLRETDGFALLDFEDAIKLRELGWTGPILMLEGFFCAADLNLIDRYSLTTTVHSEEQLRLLEMAQLSKPVSIHLKMNSGMNRLGFAPAAFRAAWERAQACPNIGQIVLMKHFSDADNANGITHQIEIFERAAAGIPGLRCLGNSAAVLWHPRTHADWVRPGVMLYGASPSGLMSDIAGAELIPAMTLSSEIIAVQDLVVGSTVGYGSLYRAVKPMRIGIVACGYADGYPLHAPTGTPVIVQGVRTQIVGRISMDMMAVDLTPVLASTSSVGIGSPVELWGKQLPIDEVAQAAGTLGYELMCAVSQRVPKQAE